MIKEIDESVYRDISLDELVVYSVYCLNEDKVEATFENIVAKSFELFPKKFTLVGYPHWPDSARVNKAWLRCRSDFKYIIGSVKSGFKLTSKGLKAVKRVQQKIKSSNRQIKNLKKRVLEERTREESFINQIEKSPIFKQYQEERNNIKLSEYEFCDLLYCTLESPFSARKNNLDLLKGYAETLNRASILNFLNFCETEYKEFLFERDREDEEQKYRGGMFKQKIKERKKK